MLLFKAIKNTITSPPRRSLAVRRPHYISPWELHHHPSNTQAQGRGLSLGPCPSPRPAALASTCMQVPFQERASNHPISTSTPTLGFAYTFRVTC